MLKELHIKNVAVIDEVRVEFQPGFNVLTGETGAGKSILIDSINMALGGRSSRELIRSGCDFAVVDLCFEVKNPMIPEMLDEMGIDTEDNLVIISRRLGTDGKSVCRINGGIVPAATVREVADALIDIHGQNDNQSLLSPKNHLRLLDDYGNLAAEKEKYKEQYKKLKDLKTEIDELNIDEDEKSRRLDMLNYQAQEIRMANIKVGEEEELIELRDRLCNMESIVSGAGTAYSALYGGEEGTAFDMLKAAERALSGIVQFDKTLKDSYERLEGIIAETKDIASDINACLSKTDFSMAQLDQIEERLDLIANLKRKYGSTIEAVIEYGKKATLEAESIEKSDEKRELLQKEYKAQLTKVCALAESLSKIRKTLATDLENCIAGELSALDMPKVRFAIEITEHRENDEIVYTETGKDLVEFLISTNPGETVKPMAKIASGGELSRIMLAVKSVLSATDDADTMIFDEIDAGVSGRAAQKIAEKISALAKTKQIFSITHLAQLASMADAHYLIQKQIDGERTKTDVRLLDKKARVDELARIIGGVAVTDLTRQSAEEMLALACTQKGL